MADRELLELAAKAAGVAITEVFDLGDAGIAKITYDGWNPLNDDGDALRLAVSLRICVDIGAHEIEVIWQENNAPVSITQSFNVGDHNAATRRAIVRAAAEVGKGMLSHNEFVLAFPGRFDEEEVVRAAAEIGKAMP